MPFSPHILNRINSLVTLFRNQLNLELDQVNQTTHPQNLLDAIHLIRKDQQIFSESLLQLIDQIKKIVFREVQSKHLTDQSFSAIRLDIQQVINPLITDFNIKCRALLKDFVTEEPAEDLVVSDFERQIDSKISDLFVEYEDQFEHLS